VNIILLGLVFISPPFLKKMLLQWFGGARFGRNAQIGWFSAVSARRIDLADHSLIRPFTVIRLEGDFHLGRYSEISSFTLIYGSSSLSVGAESYIGPQCLVNVEEPVRIGDGSALGPRSLVFTHGSYLPYTEGYWVRLAGVTLGDKVWCAAGVFLHPGAEIGDNSFVNSMSVVSGVIPPGSVVEGNPARVVYPMERVQRRMSAAHVDRALERILQEFAEIGLRRERRIEPEVAVAGDVRFHWKQRAYRIVLVPSKGELPQDDPNVQQVYLINRPGWNPPPGALSFDVATRTTRFTRDPIHTGLRLFALRYYGLRFRDSV
jgi:acetyltransferase-like isoleucine patch superfamily enzyme